MSSKLKPQLDWWVDFMKQNPVPQESLNHFSSIEWTNRWLQNPSYEVLPSFSRTTKPNGEDYFFAQTINTPETFPHYVCLKRRKFAATQVEAGIHDQATPPGRKPPATPPTEPDCVFLLCSGPGGLDGHPGVMHGGICCAILDEMMGSVIVFNLYDMEGPVRKSHAFTTYLNTTYYAQVPTPGEVLARTWLTKKEGRKWTIMGQIVDKNGTVCTEAESMYVLVTREKL